MKTCGTCKYWLEYADGRFGAQRLGTCKRNPPTVDPLSGQQALPQMLDVDWCGRHRCRWWF